MKVDLKDPVLRHTIGLLFPFLIFPMIVVILILLLHLLGSF